MIYPPGTLPTTAADRYKRNPPRSLAFAQFVRGRRSGRESLFLGRARSLMSQRYPLKIHRIGFYWVAETVVVAVGVVLLGALVGGFVKLK